MLKIRMKMLEMMMKMTVKMKMMLTMKVKEMKTQQQAWDSAQTARVPCRRQEVKEEWGVAGGAGKAGGTDL